MFARTPEQKQIIKNEQEKEVAKSNSWFYVISAVLILTIWRILDDVFNLTTVSMTIVITFFISFLLSAFIVRVVYNPRVSKKV